MTSAISYTPTEAYCTSVPALMCIRRASTAQRDRSRCSTSRARCVHRCTPSPTLSIALVSSRIVTAHDDLVRIHIPAEQPWLDVPRLASIIVHGCHVILCANDAQHVAMPTEPSVVTYMATVLVSRVSPGLMIVSCARLTSCTYDANAPTLTLGLRCNLETLLCCSWHINRVHPCCAEARPDRCGTIEAQP